MTSPVDRQAADKEQALKERIGAFGAVAVAYSGGVDSTYLADVASEVLGDNAHILIADTPSIPRSELHEALDLARGRGWNVATLHTREFDDERYLANDEQRCYYCKSELFTRMRAYAEKHKVAVLAHGDNADDRADPTRVGAAAAQEHGGRCALARSGVDESRDPFAEREAGVTHGGEGLFRVSGVAGSHGDSPRPGHAEPGGAGGRGTQASWVSPVPGAASR